MSAVFSECNKYRYRLDRDVDPLGHKVIAYFGVNPSTANAIDSDHTLDKWIGFAKINSGLRIIVANAFGICSKNVSVVSTTEDPLGELNDFYVDQIISEADILVPCWGSRTKIPIALRPRLDALFDKLKRSGKPVFVFGYTVSGDPLHVERLPYRTPLILVENCGAFPS